MNDPRIPFDPDFDEPSPHATPVSVRPYFIFGVIAGLTLASVIGIVLLLTR